MRHQVTQAGERRPLSAVFDGPSASSGTSERDLALWRAGDQRTNVTNTIRVTVALSCGLGDRNEIKEDIVVHISKLRRETTTPHKVILAERSASPIVG